MFFENLIMQAKLQQDAELRLRELISNRNYFGVDELLEQEHVALAVKAAFQILPELIGGAEVLKDAEYTGKTNNINARTGIT